MSQLTFEPVNDISNVMKAAIGNKHQAIIKMVKKLDHDLMIRALPDTFSESTSLSNLCIDKLLKSITLANCIELLEFGDLYQIDELKINCIKFIMLNMVSFFSEGTKLSEKLLALPIYLIRDIENFLKVKDIQKFLWLDMSYFEIDLDYSEFNGDGDDLENAKNELNGSNCIKRYTEIGNIAQDYMEQDKANEYLKEQLVSLAHKFRQDLRRQNKKFKRKDSIKKENDEAPNDDDALLDDDSYKPYIDQEVIGEYLELINDFIKNTIPEEMAEHISHLK